MLTAAIPLLLAACEVSVDTSSPVEGEPTERTPSDSAPPADGGVADGGVADAGDDNTEASPFTDGGTVFDDAALRDAGVAAADAQVDDAAVADGQILLAARTASVGEVEQGQLAIERAQSASVLMFAEMMVEEHSLAIESADTLAQDEGLDLTESQLSSTLELQSTGILSVLQEAGDDEFDVVYMETQVALHQQLLALLDEELLATEGGPTNAALRSYLELLRGDIEAHLEEAQMVLETLD